tara:strand:- start:12 stop:128 length:117 start_codon:yes stop_codon:yes gene_type:complete
MKTIAKAELLKELESSNLKPKLRQKINNELRRRTSYEK